MELLEKAKNIVADKMGNIKKPEASITDVDLKDVGRDGIAYFANLSVFNPYSVSDPVCDITYTLESVDRVIVSGNIPDPGSLKENNKTILEVKIKVPHNLLLSLIKDICAD
ncbi:hypothetical protein DH2020_012858 [Rehmannia glutinosa]|uniref:Late embryogenesis abundant protein LEA-2 subgroup domain-containing protein n=1 Tax=Rehmannia glutinosa TaxID=99300 RepID=A0ABR0X1B0_REHGL